MSDFKPTPPPFASFKSTTFKNAAEFIYQLGESSLLLQPSELVPTEQIGSDIFQSKVKYLKDCLQKFRQITGYGRGITAIQVGIKQRFTVIYTPERLLTIINPQITKRSGRKLKYPEMCMSLIPLITPVVRPAWIEFEYLDENGQRQSWQEKDDTQLGKIMNRVFQHEFDHMEGRLPIHLVDPREIILESDPNFYQTAQFEEI